MLPHIRSYLGPFHTRQRGWIVRRSEETVHLQPRVGVRFSGVHDDSRSYELLCQNESDNIVGEHVVVKVGVEASASSL